MLSPTKAAKTLLSVREIRRSNLLDRKADLTTD